MEEIKLSCNLCEESYLVEEYDNHLSTETHLRYAELERTYFCEICRSPASGKVPFLDHIHGRQHEKAKHKLLLPCVDAGSDYVEKSNHLEIPDVVFTKDGPYFVCECSTKCNSTLFLPF